MCTMSCEDRSTCHLSAASGTGARAPTLWQRWQRRGTCHRSAVVHTCARLSGITFDGTPSVPTHELSGATGDEYFRTNQHMMLRQQHKVPTLTRPREWHTDTQRSPMRWCDGHCAPLTHCEVVRIDRVVDRRRRGDCATSVESIAKGLHLGQCTHSLGVDLVGAWDGGREQRAIAAKCR